VGSRKNHVQNTTKNGHLPVIVCNVGLATHTKTEKRRQRTEDKQTCACTYDSPCSARSSARSKSASNMTSLRATYIIVQVHQQGRQIWEKGQEIKTNLVNYHSLLVG
jgi:hypothetical protein